LLNIVELNDTRCKTNFENNIQSKKVIIKEINTETTKMSGNFGGGSGKLQITRQKKIGGSTNSDISSQEQDISDLNLARSFNSRHHFYTTSSNDSSNLDSPTSSSYLGQSVPKSKPTFQFDESFCEPINDNNIHLKRHNNNNDHDDNNYTLHDNLSILNITNNLDFSSDGGLSSSTSYMKSSSSSSSSNRGDRINEKVIINPLIILPVESPQKEYVPIQGDFNFHFY
jgi:hypothetical protein